MTTELKIPNSPLSLAGPILNSQGRDLQEAPVWQKFSISHTLFTATMNQNIGPGPALPARSVVLATKIKHSAAFVGGSLATVTISIGDTGSIAKYHDPFDILQAPGDTVMSVEAKAGVESETSATGILANFISTGDNLNAATQGDVDFWILFAVPPA